jgi:FkbM family methyltransferase
MNSTYINEKFTQHIKSKINTIVECGSRDGLDALVMLEYYKPNRIYSFECNPESIINCNLNLLSCEKITLIPKAVSNINGVIDFYATDMDLSTDKNIGASSALYHLDNKKDFFQKKISVDAVKLSSFIEEHNLTSIDLLCLDLQGYEKFAIEGLEKEIDKVNYIISEVSFKSYYDGDILFDEYVRLLASKGFTLKETLNYGGFGDALFINNN